MCFKTIIDLQKFIKISSLFTVLGLFLFAAAPPAAYCSNPERDFGIKYMRNYSRKDYKNQSQNWSIIQDKRGVIYVANQGMLMEFDGISWNDIPIPNRIARSLAVDDNGTIYVGGMNEIGYLASDPTGALHYVSLIDFLDKKYRNFSYVWRIHAAEKGIYFCTTKYLFLWNAEEKEVTVWEAEGSFAPPFLCSGKLYTRQQGVGLLEMKKGSLELVRGGETFSSQKVYMMVEFEPGKRLIGTRSNGFYLYDGAKAAPFETDTLDFIKEKHLSHGIRLSSGEFVLATLRGGLFIIDRHGNLRHVFDKSSGLQDNTVWYVFEDFQGNLWLALNEGVTKIEYASPISIYDDSHSNLHGKVLSVVRHGPNNDLYAGTTNGLYCISPNGKFSLVPGMSGECWSILSAGTALLAATNTGIFQVENNSKRLVTREHAYVLLKSESEPNRIWAGMAHGLASLYLEKEKGQWEVEQPFENITQGINTIVEDKKGHLWLGILAEGVFKIDFPVVRSIVNPVVTRYDTSHGLPEGHVRVFSAAGHVLFATGKGIFRFEKKNKIFIPDFTFGDEFAGGENGRGVFLIKEDSQKHIWLHSKARNVRAIPQSDGTYVLDKKPFSRIPLAHVDTIYPDPIGDITWFASVDGLIRYDTKVKKNYDLDFQTLIRKVWVNGKPVFNSYKIEGVPKNSFPVIEYRDRSLRFAFAAPFFEAETETLYQCLLEGYDDHWTAWNKETWKDYTNVDSGLNTFRVRAKNIYGNISREASFQFKVLSPWYRTWWAVSVYAVGFFLLVYLIVKWRSIHLEKEKQTLEQIIKERTKEIFEKSQQLEEQSEKLKEMDKVKSRFFANISHEFRTPLTLIMGPLEQMLTSSREDEREQKKKMRLMLRNSQRLLGLINQLLELSKFDSGTMKLQASRQDIVPFLKGIFHSFDSLAVRYELDLKFQTEAENIILYFDTEKMEEVIANLLSNAVKFTPAGGRITLSVKKALPGTDQQDFLEVSVSDTGPGIPREALAHIFDRFFQSDSTYGHHQKGSGIGLAIAREIIELHHGKISAHSREGEGSGTEFVIQLPMGKAHLKPEEIVDSYPAPQKPGTTGASSKMPFLEVIEGEEEGEPAEKDRDIVKEPGIPKKDIILVVEDSVDVQQYIRGALEPLYTVVEARDGEKGLRKAREMVPDLIICDIMMPGVDGYEVCRILKNDIVTSHIPIILLTAKASEEDILQGLETGADDYITKPFSTRILCARIQNLIDLRRHLQQTWNREMTLQPTKIAVSEVDREFIKELKQVMEKNISDTEFNVDQLCRKLYMSHATLYRKIHALTGETPTDFIRSYRLKRGAELLKKGMESVLEVALEVGFSSANYFSKCFKKKFHQLPTEYQATETER
jgi:signal transduction histidine kinase/DNA-binding response OmpR family regulator